MSTTTPTKTELRESAGRLSSAPAPRHRRETNSGALSRTRYDGLEPDGRAEWLRDRARQPELLDPAKLIPGGSAAPLLWALPDALHDSPTQALIGRLAQIGRNTKHVVEPELVAEAEAWLETTCRPAPDAGYALECLAWCHVLRKLLAAEPAALWWQVLESLIGTASNSAPLRLADDPLAHQLLAGELPLTLAYLFGKIKHCGNLLPGARQALSEGPVELLDGEGLPNSAHLGLLRGLLACWTRSGFIARGMKTTCFRRDAQVQYEWLVRQALRLTRYDGSQVLSDGTSGAWCKELFKAALDLSDDSHDWAIADMTLPGRVGPVASDNGDNLPRAAIESEWAETAVLRRDWSRTAERLTVAYGGGSISVELNCGRETVCSGTWEPQVLVAGKRLLPESDWVQVCWVSDEDVDYLELEVSLCGGWRIQRHMLLVRQERFLLLADAILGSSPRRIDYRCRLPLSGETTFHAADETREGRLVGEKPIGRVMPLALPEWRADGRPGALALADGDLQLEQAAEGRSLFAPLFIDLDRRRLRKQLTWRQLTVARELEILPDDVAVGYRVQVGSQQWLIYRSLGQSGNHTLLGHSLSTEFLVARFDRSGEAEPLLEIE